MNVIFTKHVINQLYNRGISQSDAWNTFQHPDGSVPGKTPNSRKFYKNYGQKRIEIVAKQNEKGEWIILTGWIKQLGSNQSGRRPPQAATSNFLERLIMKGLNKLTNLLQKNSRKKN